MLKLTPIQYRRGYLPIEDHALIGDGSTAALVGRDGAISWMCVPRFDAPPLFCKILDVKRGGAFTITPEGLTESAQYYEYDSGVVVTEMRSPSGLIQLTDALTFRSGADLTEDSPAGRNELLRLVKVLQGSVRLKIEFNPRGGADNEPAGGGFRIRCSAQPGLELHLSCSSDLGGLQTIRELREGEELHLILRWSQGGRRYHAATPQELVRGTLSTWRRWMRNFAYHGPQEPLIRRSAITLKLLDYFANGAIVAAPTSSLPEAIDGPRNWDYRYTWIRDAAFSVYALRRIGFSREAAGFLGWVMDAIEQTGHPRVLYNLDAKQPPPEHEDLKLEGYRGSSPVRWGNGAADQSQNDVYGEMMDCAYQWARGGGQIDAQLWTRLLTLIQAARNKWHQPDHGIWEVRTPGRVFTYSAALCQVALDRGARLAERLGTAGDIQGWKQAAVEIRSAILNEAWDEDRQTLTEHIGGGGLDASLLSLPLRRVIPADHPRMVATASAIEERLGAGHGLIYRYLPGESPDGLPGHEGAFLLCSFWLVDNLAMQGRLREATDLYNSLCARAGNLGLLSEQIDPSTGAFLGNYPQAFSHIGVISSGVNLGRLTNGSSSR